MVNRLDHHVPKTDIEKYLEVWLPGHVRAADIAYTPMRGGFVYLFGVLIG
jgi:hypothetical protein